MRAICLRGRPTWTEWLEMDIALFQAICETIPLQEDGNDLRYLANMLGKSA